jgi:radical SAM protein with 4Fe4S-binding SPASM domain
MSTILFNKIIDEAAHYLPITVTLFFRGESLLHDHFPQFIAYAKERGMGPIQLASNGLVLDEAIGEKILDAGLDFISFSLDTCDDDVYRRTRQHGSLQTSTDNVLRFIRKCQIRRSQGLSVPEIQVSTVDVPDYREGQERFIAFWRQYADKVRVYIEHSTDNNFGSISQELPLDNAVRKPCKKLMTDMVIYWDGTVALCNHDWGNAGYLGNVNKQSIESIWKSDAYQKVRVMHQQGIFPDSMVCGKCDHWQMFYLADGFLGKVYCKE